MALEVWSGCETLIQNNGDIPTRNVRLEGCPTFLNQTSNKASRTGMNGTGSLETDSDFLASAGREETADGVINV